MIPERVLNLCTFRTVQVFCYLWMCFYFYKYFVIFAISGSVLSFQQVFCEFLDVFPISTSILRLLATLCFLQMFCDFWICAHLTANFYIMSIHFSSEMTWNNWEMLTETRSCIF